MKCINSTTPDGNAKTKAKDKPITSGKDSEKKTDAGK